MPAISVEQLDGDGMPRTKPSSTVQEKPTRNMIPGQRLKDCLSDAADERDGPSQMVLAKKLSCATRPLASGGNGCSHTTMVGSKALAREEGQRYMIHNVPNQQLARACHERLWLATTVTRGSTTYMNTDSRVDIH
eukprot:COSAG06_NODE_2908_length_6105_cov_9.949384_3_plen_135_part_00